MQKSFIINFETVVIFKNLTQRVNMTKESYFLLFISIGVIPAAVGYGLNPKELLPVLYGIEVPDNNLSNIFRAVMGLYIGCVLLWIFGAFKKKSYGSCFVVHVRLYAWDWSWKSPQFNSRWNARYDFCILYDFRVYCCRNYFLFTQGKSIKYFLMVPRGGIEPPTQGFSVLCSTD